LNKANSFENVIDNAFKRVKESKKKVGILPITKSKFSGMDNFMSIAKGKKCKLVLV